MTFQEAKDKLKIVSKNQYRSIQYSESISDYGDETHNCQLYIHDYGLHKGKIWEEAFESLDKAMNPSKYTPTKGES